MRELRRPNTVTDAVFAAVVDHSRPMLTYYDDATGERTELSGATLGNWAAKTANYLLDEAGVMAGDVVVVDLPEHWQTAGILLGALWAGADVRLAAGEDDARVVFTHRDRLDAHPDADEVLLASLDAFALPQRDLPAGVGDYGSVVRVHGDQFASPTAAGAALYGEDTEAVIATAETAAEANGISAGARVASTRSWHTRSGVVENLLAPLVVGAGLVHIANASPERVSTIAETEKAGLVLT